MFWLKKIVSQLFMPIPLVLFILLLAFIVIRNRQRSRLLLVMAASLLIILSSGSGSNALLKPLENSYAVNNSPIEQGCLVIVLGSGHDENPSLTAVQQLSTTALARLTEGLRQLSLGQDCKLVVSGWSGGLATRSHADVMFDAAVELGVDPSVIIKFPLAKDTIEEAQFMRWEVADAPFRLVTSASHMPRAMAIFENEDLNVSAAPTDFAQRRSYWWRFDAMSLLNSQRAIHEYLGLAWFKIKHQGRTVTEASSNVDNDESTLSSF
ncbi:YdcF family protein [Shewanella pneumatophori]|uniref:YdcF family protein n=1 Tax=Shewanella pneumatophori TaxID=314092 RepID=A0A9X1ZC31_9GAMM|nr:ElyC/SanA/YdcF family protein [Shewanella pneumatophori]MCL1139529.1 YdcF family protein [Shewanella pneumatophori]